MFAEEFVAPRDPAVSMETATSIWSNQPNGIQINAELLSKIETQLSQSDVYLRAVESLQHLTAEPGIDGQILLKAVSLEAIRVTLDAVNEKPKTEANADVEARDEATVAALEVTAASESSNAEKSNINDEIADNDVFSAIESVVYEAKPKAYNPLGRLFDRYKVQRQQAVEEVQTFTRAEILAQIGAQIQLERERQDLTIAQLHARTFIPIYHLQALESGHAEQLPEDIYLRGFLRRIENALNLEVDALLSKMPQEMDKATLPSWAGHAKGDGRRGFAGLDVNPTHLYVTYAAILAGGVYWLSSQTPPTVSMPDLGNYEPKAEAPANKSLQQLKPKANLTANQADTKKTQATTSVKVGSTSNVAPPEMMR